MSIEWGEKWKCNNFLSSSSDKIFIFNLQNRFSERECCSLLSWNNQIFSMMPNDLWVQPCCSLSNKSFCFNYQSICSMWHAWMSEWVGRLGRIALHCFVVCMCICIPETHWNFTKKFKFNNSPAKFRPVSARFSRSHIHNNLMAFHSQDWRFAGNFWRFKSCSRALFLFFLPTNSFVRFFHTLTPSSQKNIFLFIFPACKQSKEKRKVDSGEQKKGKERKKKKTWNFLWHSLLSLKLFPALKCWIPVEIESHLVGHSVREFC